ncbi:sensor histidine kinase [Schlesneria paludicola]|uniref:sensor histidine kinase n=1 Tax=Schlesneria paludicola TaxID=360056 RepID=UPI00029AE0F5|nr:sensor histidine kinase [Schlesneria paludicola]
MTTNLFSLLATLIQQQRPALLERWRRQMRRLPSAGPLDLQALNDHIPMLLDEFVATLRTRADQTNPEELPKGSSPAHGLQRLQDDFDIEEVVAEYNILRACIHDVADENGISLQGQPFHLMNGFFDHAIGCALQAYATRRSHEEQQRRNEYLSFVTHDLRTPLNAISLAGKVLEMTIPKDSSSVESIQMLTSLRRNVEHLEKLIGKVLEENAHLESSSGIKVERREFDLWPLVESLIHDLRPMSDTSGTKLTNQVPPNLVVYADASLLHRVFQNLLANAIKYAPQGEVIVIAREQPQEETVECQISDNGSGIPVETLDQVFDKGVSDPDNEEGLGLGLAIVKTFIEAHDGSVTVESQHGTGTIFRFSLPNRTNTRPSTSPST